MAGGVLAGIWQPGRIPPTSRWQSNQGGLEWRHEADFERHGIPIAEDHQKSLQDLADELGIDTPFAQYESTRFGASS